MGMDVDGVAYATIISNLVSVILLLVNLMRREGATRVVVSKLRIDRRLTVAMLKIGIPSGLQSMVFSLSNLAVQSAVNSLGPDIVAASAASFYVEIFCFFILNSFGQATVTFIGQNYGAGKLDRCTAIVRRTLVLDIGLTMAACCVVLVFGHQLLAIFNKDPEVVRYGYERLLCMLPFEWLNCIMDILSQAMRGFGHSLVPAVITFLGVCGTRIVWVFTVFRQAPSLRRLMTVYPISWGITAAILILLYFRVKRKAYSISSRKI